MSKKDVLLFTCYGKQGNGKSYMEHLKAKDKEIERLNNIINELEKHFEFLKMNSAGGNKEFMEDILDFIKELKGSEKE